MSKMEIYLVGGAVRDELLGLPIKEKDYVVVGATVDEMLQQKYRQVGKDFPVFLHPKTHEEYALARMERKVSRGYTGFTFDTAPTVTLEEDLLRRDLTINAMAKNLETGQLIDPFHGQADLQKKLLRHVSPAFVEDPVRILRIARFAARFACLGFTVAPETNTLMKQMVQNGEVDALVAERVWKELERALQEKNPEVFFEVLRDCDALPVLFPELQPDNVAILKKIMKISEDPETRFATMLSGLSPDKIKSLTDRFRIPGTYKELALLVSKYHSDTKNVNEQSAEKIVDLLQAVDAFRREPRFMKFLMACEVVNVDASANKQLVEILAALKELDIKPLLKMDLKGEQLAAEIKKARIERVKHFLK